VILHDGTTVYQKQGDITHREDGPAVIWPSGIKEWYIDSKHHRVDGPAIESPNGRQWLIEGMRHREDGPAIEGFNKQPEWYLNDKKLRIIPKYILINYMKANNLTVAHLFTDPDPLVRKSVSKYKWS
jgi:hypothetical protein